MNDVALVYVYKDHAEALGLADMLAGRGLDVGRSVSLWPGQRLLKQVDAALVDARWVVALISREFLACWGRKELDGLALRRRVACLLCRLDEADVVPESPNLAASALPGSLAGQLVRLIRA